MDELRRSPRLEPDVAAGIAADEDSLRIVCYNVRHCRGSFSPFVSEARVARAIRGLYPDIVGLTEVFRTTHRDQPERLSRLIGMTPHYHGVRSVHGGAYGNLMMSTLPMEPILRLPLKGRREDRGCLLTEVRWGSRHVTIALTHLGLDRGTRRSQIAEIARVLPRGAPLVLMGDFNGALWELEPLHELVRPCSEQPRTFPAVLPVAPLDRILFSRHFESRRVFAARSLASDHRPVVMELAWRR